ncbi:MAG: hypothetical protein LUF27_17195 [Lachnospiraceae bacterium]|nr:hypothetical protein [Lachnospiraceae bacterium]
MKQQAYLAISFGNVDSCSPSIEGGSLGNVTELLHPKTSRKVVTKVLQAILLTVQNSIEKKKQVLSASDARLAPTGAKRRHVACCSE